MENDFEILHHTYRVKWASGEKIAKILDEDTVPDWQYYVYNLVFRASNEFKPMCMNDTLNWKKGRVCIDTEKYDQYIDSLSFRCLKDQKIEDEKGNPYYEVKLESDMDIDPDTLYVKGHIENFSPFLVYIPKFDVFQFREYLQYNPATQGIIQFIEELKSGCNYGITANYSQFYSCLKALEGFWD